MKSLVLGFLLIYGIARCAETFWRRPNYKGKVVAPYSIRLIISAYVALYVLVMWDANEMVAIPVWSAVTGMLFILGSIAGRNWAIRSLGPYHSIQIEIRNCHELITSGPYRYIRNPYYLSNIVEAVGLVLFVHSWLAILISLIVYLPVLAHRIMLEERALQTECGATFEVYKTQVPRLWPSPLRLLRDK